MSTRKQKNEMAKICGLSEERRVELIREDVEEIYDPADETAILRKAVALLFEVISTLHEGEIDNEEFKKYNARIEDIKKRVSEELGI